MYCLRPQKVSPRAAAQEKWVGCGKCNACRITRRRQIAARILMERNLHPQTSFVTLTYATKHLPRIGILDGRTRGVLLPRHYQLLIKRLRKHRRLRYVFAGEYGDKFGRPHYHGVLFGWEPDFAERVLLEEWCYGNVDVSELNEGRANYISGYAVKKWTKVNEWNEKKLDGRPPEFCRWSTDPGVGALYVPHLARAMRTRAGGQHLAGSFDIPHTVRIGPKAYPLDDYMKRKLRVALGRQPTAPEESRRWRRLDQEDIERTRRSLYRQQKKWAERGDL